MRTDIEIAKGARLKPIGEIAEDLGLLPEEIEPYGHYKAKISLSVLGRLNGVPNGKYIDVTAITPTPLGEGKTVVTIGLSMALNRLGKKAVATLRQPSLGPVFGVKGGAAGGGYSQVVPMEEFNLHLTGDVHAVSMAHNLLAAMLDSHLGHGNRLGIDPLSITWPRVVDLNDRALRQVVIGLGGRDNGIPRETRFDIAVASEAMAALGLSRDIFDLRRRLGRILVGYTREGKPVTSEDLKGAGAMAILLREAIKPNLMQTAENTSVVVHTGPFANIAHGNCSILADLVGLKLAEYVVTESGFGADMGMEKMMDIKCRASGLVPDAVVVVCSLRALKTHGGKFRVVPGRPLDPALEQPNPEALMRGLANLEKQVENVRTFGVPAVVAVNRFPSDTREEIALVLERVLESGAESAHVVDVWGQGGAGGEELAWGVMRAAEKPKEFRFLYPLDAPIKEKIEAIATRIYGADGVDYAPLAERQIRQYAELGWANLPICIAKTHLSLSHDAALKGRPRGFRLPVREVKAALGAGYLYPIAGDIRLMPGLPSEPGAAHMDIDAAGNIVGLA